MNKKLKLKSYVLPTIYIILFISVFYFTLVFSNTLSKKINKPKEKEEIIKEVVKEETPVENKVLMPFIDQEVKVGRSYYDYKGDINSQKNSITYYKDTYMQNTGIDYINEKVFDVQSILDGTVISVKDDEDVGKIIEIKHDNNYISSYQSLSEVLVKKDDRVTKGMIIGKSGTNNIDKDLGNHLHFELYVNGGIVDPNLYLNKELNKN